MNHVELWKFVLGGMFGMFAGFVFGAIAMKVDPGFFAWKRGR